MIDMIKWWGQDEKYDGYEKHIKETKISKDGEISWQYQYIEKGHRLYFIPTCIKSAELSASFITTLKESTLTLFRHFQRETILLKLNRARKSFSFH